MRIELVIDGGYIAQYNRFGREFMCTIGHRQRGPREDHPMERRLAAIFSTDVKGYSRLMGEDEIATIRTLTAYRELMATLIQQHRGRVVDSPGDNLPMGRSTESGSPDAGAGVGGGAEGHR
jgi:class 3 adenylate cyclase